MSLARLRLWSAVWLVLAAGRAVAQTPAVPALEVFQIFHLSN